MCPSKGTHSASTQPLRQSLQIKCCWLGQMIPSRVVRSSLPQYSAQVARYVVACNCRDPLDACNTRLVRLHHLCRLQILGPPACQAALKAAFNEHCTGDKLARAILQMLTQVHRIALE
jgi:hypothetical protein